MHLITAPDRPGLVRLASSQAGEPWHRSVHLLSDEDLDEIDRYGVPCGPRPDLTTMVDGRLVFTEMGLQYYRHSLMSHVISARLEAIVDKAGLIDLHAEIFGAVRRKARTQLHAELEAGRVPVADREIVEARLFGTVADMARAMRRHLQFAGLNIIPVAFKKKRRS